MFVRVIVERFDGLMFEFVVRVLGLGRTERILQFTQRCAEESGPGLGRFGAAKFFAVLLHADRRIRHVSPQIGFGFFDGLRVLEFVQSFRHRLFRRFQKSGHRLFCRFQVVRDKRLRFRGNCTLNETNKKHKNHTGFFRSVFLSIFSPFHIFFYYL